MPELYTLSCVDRLPHQLTARHNTHAITTSGTASSISAHRESIRLKPVKGVHRILDRTHSSTSFLVSIYFMKEHNLDLSRYSLNAEFYSRMQERGTACGAHAVQSYQKFRVMSIHQLTVFPTWLLLLQGSTTLAMRPHSAWKTSSANSWSSNLNFDRLDSVQRVQSPVV